MRLQRRVGVAVGRRDGVERWPRAAAMRSASSAGHADADHRPALAGDGRDDRELDVVVGGVEVEEQLVDLVEHLVGAGVLAVDLVEHDDGRQVRRPAPSTARSGSGAAGPRPRRRAAATPSTIARARSTSPPKSAWPGVSTRLILHALPRDRGGLGEDGDAPLALLVVGVHDPVDDAPGGRAKTPVARSMASTRVVLPWSTWATSATLRRWVASSGRVAASRGRRRRRASAVQSRRIVVVVGVVVDVTPYFSASAAY